MPVATPPSYDMAEEEDEEEEHRDGEDGHGERHEQGGEAGRLEGWRYVKAAAACRGGGPVVGEGLGTAGRQAKGSGGCGDAVGLVTH